VPELHQLKSEIETAKAEKGLVGPELKIKPELENKIAEIQKLEMDAANAEVQRLELESTKAELENLKTQNKIFSSKLKFGSNQRFMKRPKRKTKSRPTRKGKKSRKR